jgi:hypothetical protein
VCFSYVTFHPKLFALLFVKVLKLFPYFQGLRGYSLRGGAESTAPMDSPKIIFFDLVLQIILHVIYEPRNLLLTKSRGNGSGPGVSDRSIYSLKSLCVKRFVKGNGGNKIHMDRAC